MGKKRTRRYTKRAASGGTAPVGAGTGASTAAPVVGSFTLNQNQVENPDEYENPDYAKTNLDVVKEQHPGMTDAQGRLIVNAQNHRDSVKDRLTGKEEKLQAARDNLYKAYIDQYDNVETEQEKADRQRREKKAQRWAAVGDAISALANIGGAMGGATPIKPSKTLSQGQAERMEYARKLRELEQKRLSEKNKNRYKMVSKEYDAAKKDYDNGVKSLASANKNIDEAEYKAMTLQASTADKERQQSNIDRAFEHTVEKDNTAAAQRQQQINNQHDYQQGQLYLGHERNQISASKGSGGGSQQKDSERWYNLGQRSRASNRELFNKWISENRSTVRRMTTDSDRLKAFGAAIESGYGSQPRVTPKQPTKPKSAGTGGGSLLPNGKQQAKTQPKKPAAKPAGTGGGSLLPKKK